jgi:hypothetical protein
MQSVVVSTRGPQDFTDAPKQLWRLHCIDLARLSRRPPESALPVGCCWEEREIAGGEPPEQP